MGIQKAVFGDLGCGKDRIVERFREKGFRACVRAQGWWSALICERGGRSRQVGGGITFFLANKLGEKQEGSHGDINSLRSQRTILDWRSGRHSRAIHTIKRYREEVVNEPLKEGARPWGKFASWEALIVFGGSTPWVGEGLEGRKTQLPPTESKFPGASD